MSLTFQAAGQKPPVHKGASIKIVHLFPIGTKWKPSGLLAQGVDVYQLNLTLYSDTSRALLPKAKLTPNRIPYDLESDYPVWGAVFKFVFWTLESMKMACSDEKL